ncbi:MAG: DUF4124 domain-containing protein [Gammaproteobacteria bacterium]
MKPYLLPLVLGLLPAAFAADLYKSVDKDGHTVYTDHPVPGAELVKGLGEVPTVESFKPPPPAPAPAKPAGPVPYEVLAVTTPAPEATIRDNTGNLQVIVSLKPALQAQFGHRVVLYVDGKPFSTPGMALTFQLTNLDRGTHTLRARILDSKGGTFESSSLTRFHLHRASVNNPAGRAGQAK